MEEKANTYPYQITSLEDLDGEVWEDIPGLDGYFLISNFGRIKRERYQMQYCNGALYIKQEKIIKPHIIKQPNKFKGDYTYFLSGRVTLHGRRHNVTIARMVYYLFVAPFNLDDSKTVILCKDGDNFNIQPANLVMATSKQKQQRSVASKRFRSPLLDLNAAQRQERREAIVKKASKLVSQYNFKGKKLKTYPSAAAAQRATGVFATSIGKVAAGEDISAGGFIWRWGKASNLDVDALKKEKREAYVKKYGQKVTQYDMTGRKVGQFPSVRDASEASGVSENAINGVLSGKYKSTKGYFWKKGYGKDQIDLSNHKWGRQSMALTQSKPVKQYSLEGKYIQTFSSVKTAALSLGVKPSTLTGALKGKQHTCGGFTWQYVHKKNYA